MAANEPSPPFESVLEAASLQKTDSAGASPSHELSSEDRRRRWRDALMIGVLALTLNLVGNGRISLWDRDEPRYAVCAREMRASGDWFHPTFNAGPRYQKPALIYWLMLVGTALGGDNPFGVRLVSVFAGTGTCLLTWLLGRRLFRPRVGLLAGLMVASAPIMVAESKLATTDATLAFWLVACQVCLWELHRRPTRRAAMGFWVLLGLATLTKGPVGPALIALSALVSWWWGGPLLDRHRLHWRWGVAAYAAVTVPWFLWIGIVTRGAFFHEALGHQLLNRVARGVENHGGFPGYYLVTSLIAFHPWSALVPAAVVGAWVRRRTSPAFGFLLGWIVGPWVLLEAVGTKLVHYYLPAYPACALVVAWMIVAVAQDEVNLRRWPLGRLGLGLLVGIGTCGMVGAIGGAVALPGALRGPLLLMGVAIGAGTFWSLEKFQSGGTERAAQILVATWVAVLLVAGAWLGPAAEPFRTTRIVGERLRDLAERHHATAALGSFQEPSIVYAFGRPAVLIRSKKAWIDLVQRSDAVVSALYPREAFTLRQMPSMKVETVDTLRGFNLTKGYHETIELAVVRRRGPVRTALAEQPRVK